MRKYFPAVSILMLTVLSAVIFFIGRNTILALLFAVLAVLVWASLPSVLGKVSTEGERIDAKKLKDFRRIHPGSTVEDAIRANRE